MDTIHIAHPDGCFGAEGIGQPLTLSEWIDGKAEHLTLAEVIAWTCDPEQWSGTGMDLADLIEPTIREAEGVLGGDPHVTTVGQIRRALGN